jgi:hypothetical protein
MRKVDRRNVWWEVLALPTWRWVVLIPIAILGTLQLVRDEFLPPDTAEKYKLPKLVSGLSWHWWVVILLVVIVFILLESTFRAIRKRENEIDREKYRADQLSERFEPKLKISSSMLLLPSEATKGLRTVRINIENVSAITLRNCCVREAMFVNRFEHSSGMQRHFRLSEETFADMAGHTYRKTFDLRGQGSSEIIDIAQLDETKDDSRVVMLYATEPTAQTLNAIIRDCFPHRLTISVTADNLPVAERRTYELKISEIGTLEMIAGGES